VDITKFCFNIWGLASKGVGKGTRVWVCFSPGLKEGFQQRPHGGRLKPPEGMFFILFEEFLERFFLPGGFREGFEFAGHKKNPLRVEGGSF
jgi:hypothetical protein